MYVLLLYIYSLCLSSPHIRVMCAVQAITIALRISTTMHAVATYNYLHTFVLLAMHVIKKVMNEIYLYLFYIKFDNISYESNIMYFTTTMLL